MSSGVFAGKESTRVGVGLRVKGNAIPDKEVHR